MRGAPSNDRPLTQAELARLAAGIEPDEEAFELEGTRTFSSITFDGGDHGEAPTIDLRPILDDEGRETLGWNIVSPQRFTFGLKVRTVGRARLPER